MENNSRPQWTSQLSFVLATVGSAVGLGNIWRFPYVMGQNGGAVFLIIYLLLIFLICVVPLIAELLLGKTFSKDVFGCFSSVSPKLKIFAYICILSSVLVPCFYFVVGGWILKYIWLFLHNFIPANYSSYFSNFIAEPIPVIFFSLLFLILTVAFPLLGVKNGIEKANNVMMPLFAIMLAILAIISLNLPNSHAGLAFMFKPDFSKFTSKALLMATGQALFTLSIGMGALITYGSYLKKHVNLIKTSYILIICDTLFALLAGIMIFPAVFSLGLSPSEGPSLVFMTMPQVFAQLEFGNLTGLIFFVLLFFASITSGISLVEVPIASLVDNFKLSRVKASVIVSVIIGLITIPSALSFGVLKDFTIFDMTVFSFLDFTTSNILMPLNALVVCFIVGWLMKPKMEELTKNKVFWFVFNFLLKFIIPVIFILLILFGLEIIKL